MVVDPAGAEVATLHGSASPFVWGGTFGVTLQGKDIGSVRWRSRRIYDAERREAANITWKAFRVAECKVHLADHPDERLRAVAIAVAVALRTANAWPLLGLRPGSED